MSFKSICLLLILAPLCVGTILRLIDARTRRKTLRLILTFLAMTLFGLLTAILAFWLYTKFKLAALFVAGLGVYLMLILFRMGVGKENIAEWETYEEEHRRRSPIFQKQNILIFIGILITVYLLHFSKY